MTALPGALSPGLGARCFLLLAAPTRNKRGSWCMKGALSVLGGGELGSLQADELPSFFSGSTRMWGAGSRRAAWKLPNCVWGGDV